MRSSRSLPRKRSRRNPAPCHSVSRADSATCREWMISSFVCTFSMSPLEFAAPGCRLGRRIADSVIKLTRCGSGGEYEPREGPGRRPFAGAHDGPREIPARGEGDMIGSKMQEALNRHVHAE